MDSRNGWLPDDSSHYLTRCNPLLRLRPLRGHRDHRYLHGGIGSCRRPSLPWHRHGAREFRKGSGERGCGCQRDNLPHDVPGRNLLATRDTARYHEDHSQLHAVDIRERWAARCADLRGTGPSIDKHDHRPRLSGILHRTWQYVDELEGRVVMPMTTRIIPALSLEQ